MAYNAPRKKKEWWETALDWVGRTADKIIPGDQSSWHSGGDNKPSTPSRPQQVTPTVWDNPVQVFQNNQTQNNSPFGQKPLTFGSLDLDKLFALNTNKPKEPEATVSPLNTNKPKEPEATVSPLNTKAINERLDKGYSWERIAKETNTDLDKVKQYSQKTRPNYGIAPAKPKPEQPKHTFTDYRMEKIGNKKILGLDVGQYMGDYGDLNKMTVDQTTELTTDEFLKGFDYISRENAKNNTGKQTRDVYVNKLKEKAEAGDKNAIFTLKTLNDNKKLEGDWTDFIDSANKKFYGGLQQSGARAIEYLPGEQGTGKWADEQEKLNKSSTKAGGYGETAGQVLRTGLDIGTMIVPAGSVDKVVKGTKFVQGLNNGSKLGSAAAFTARTVPGSLVASGIDIGSQDLQGNDQNLAKSLALGTGIDLGLPVAGKVISKIPGVKQAGGFVMDQAGNFVRQTGNVIEAGKNNVREIRNSVDDLLDNFVKKAETPKVKIVGNQVPKVTNLNPIDDLSRNAKNSLVDDTTGMKPNGVERSGGFVENGTAKPIEVRTLDNGKQVIVDGRHTLEYARQNGITDYPIKDVTDQYAPATANKRAIDADATMERLRQRAANPITTSPLDEWKTYYNLNDETVARLERDYGTEKTLRIFERNKDASNIDNWNGFLVSQAQKNYGKVAPTGKVKISQAVPEQRVISDEELAAMEAAEFGTPNNQEYRAGSREIVDENGLTRRESINSREVREANIKTVTVEEGGDLYTINIKENNLGDVLFERYDSNGTYMDTVKRDRLAKDLPNLSDEELAAKSVYGTGKLVNTATGEIVDDVPPVREAPTTPEQLDAMPPVEPPVRPQVEASETPLGKITETFYDNKQGNKKITFRELEHLGTQVSREADTAFKAIGSDFRTVAQTVEEANRNGIRNLDEVNLSDAEKQLWRNVEAEMDYVRRRASIGKRDIGKGDFGETYVPNVSKEEIVTHDTLFDGFRQNKPGNEIKRMGAMEIDELTFDPSIIGNYITRYGDTKLLQEERIYRAMVKNNPDIADERVVREAAQSVINLQNKVNNLKTKITLGGVGKKVTINEGKVVDFADEMNKIGKQLGKEQIQVTATPRGLTNGDRINSVTIDDGGQAVSVGDYIGINQIRDSGAYAGTQAVRANGDKEMLAELVAERLNSSYKLPQEDVDYAVQSILNMKPDLPTEVVAARLTGIYRNAGKSQLLERLQQVNIQNKTLRNDISTLSNQILREGSIEQELSAKVVQGTLRAQNALFRKLNVSSALNELSDMTSFFTIYGKNLKVFTPDFQLVKQLGLGELDPALEPFLKQVNDGVPINKVLDGLKKLNDGTRFYKFVETYKAGVMTKTARDFYSQPKNGGLVGDELTARILQDYRDFALPVDMFTKTFLDDYPLYTQYMTWGARNLEKEGKMLTGQFDAGVMKDKSTAQRIARDLYANIPAKTVFWLSSNALKGTSIMTAFGLTDFTGLTNQDYSGIQEEDKSFFDKTTQWTNMSTTLSILNTSIQALEKEGLKQKYADADYNPYEHSNFGDSFVNTYTPQFLKNALGAKDLQDKGYSEAKSGRVQYEAPDDPWNVFKSFVFGKNQTANARKYSGRENLAERMAEGTNPFQAVSDMAQEQMGIKDADYNRPLTDDYSEKYKSLKDADRTALLDGGRMYNSLLDDLKKNSPDLYNNYISSMQDHVNPEMWRARSMGEDGKVDLTTFKMIGDRKKQLAKDLGTAYDPMYDLPDDQAAAVLRYKSTPTGEDIAVRNMLNKEQWYKDFKARQGEFYDKQQPADDGEYKNTERVKQWNVLEDQLNSFYYDAESIAKDGAPAWAEQFPTVFQQKQINDKYGFGSEESKNFFRSYGDAYKAEKEGYDKAQLDVINQMRAIEGYPPMSWEGYQQATEFADTDGDSDSKSGWKNYGSSGRKSGGSGGSGGSGSSSISPSAGGSYSSVGNSTGASSIKITKAPTVKLIKRGGGAKKITIKRGGKIK